MLIGINWIAPQTFPLIEQLIADGIADFCEIMVDNFIHLEPKHLQKICKKIPVAFHFVATRFLERDEKTLKQLAERISQLSDCLQPLYLSDHLVRFRDEQGRNLPFVIEPCYQQEEQSLIDKLTYWQSLLPAKLYIENHASLTMNGKNQPNFFKKLMFEHNLGLLFDFSNAYIAERNGIAEQIDWESLILTTDHFHVGGFRIKNDFYLDTHDTVVAPEVLHGMTKIFKNHTKKQVTCVVEFDAKVSLDSWKQAITDVRESYEQNKQ